MVLRTHSSGIVWYHSPHYIWYIYILTEISMSHFRLIQSVLSINSIRLPQIGNRIESSPKQRKDRE